jgi:hypothetical protein
MSRHREGEDPLWTLTLEIAGKLWLYGEHVVEIDPAPTQRHVDLQWAARQAGRLLGVRTHLEITPAGDRSPVLVVRITYVDPDGDGLVKAQDGLDSLVRAVHDEQLAETQGGRRRRRGWPHGHPDRPGARR